MRPGLRLAGGLAASAFVLSGAFLAFVLTRPPGSAAGAPPTWEVAPPALSPVARSPRVHAAAARPPLRAILRRVREKRCPPLQPATLGRAVAGELRPGAALGPPAGDVFHVRLESSMQTPRGYAYADALRAALARQGAVAARPAGRVIWSVDRRLVARLDDGARIAVVGGYGVTELSFRELTPGACRLLFATAEGARAYVAYAHVVLQPAGVGPGGEAGPEPVDGPGALCARLRPAFDAWRRTAPSAPLDLADLDRREVSISSPGGGALVGRRASARPAFFY